MEKQSTKTVTITLTQNCNLSCSYCYEHNKSSQKMQFATAKKIIDAEINNCDKWITAFEFDLFGGEPFLEFDLIKKITEYACDNIASIPYTIFASTNGTLVHGEIQDWLKAHKDCFVCGLSLDGTKAMHNVNRSNSYDDIDLDFFLNQYPKQDVKMTISRETLPYLADGVIELHNKGFLVSCNLAYDIDWSSQDNTVILQRELKKLIDFYLIHPNIEPCSMLEISLINIGNYIENAIRYCGAGRFMTAYDVDGQSYPCQFFMPLSIGKEKATIAKSIEFPHDIIPEMYLDEKCRSCVIRSACQNCFGANYSCTGSIYSRDENMCKLMKTTAKSISYFRARQWELGQLKESGDELQALLRAIVRVQDELEV